MTTHAPRRNANANAKRFKTARTTTRKAHNATATADTAPAEPTAPVDSTRLDNRAMLVHLSIGYWEGRKKDKQKTAEVCADENATADAGQWWTRVIPKSAIRNVLIARLHARETHLRFTLPWRDDGQRVLPAAIYLKYMEKMREHEQEYRTAVAAFLAEYPTYVADAAQRLGGLFRSDFFPNAAQLADKYPFRCAVFPLPTAGDFRVDLGADQTAQIRESIERESRQAMEGAMADLWTRLHEQTKRIAEKLADSEGVFRDSLIGNVVELCELLPLMNVTGSPELMAARDEVIAKLGKQKPQDLRDNPALRADTAKAAAEILAKMEEFLPKN